MMKKKYTNMERRGLPGGPNEIFTYTTGVFSTEGYKRNSPDVDNPFNIIDSNHITMKGVDFPVVGTDNLGNSKIMMPGNDYQFPGDQVFEVPMAQDGKEKEGKVAGNSVNDWWYNLEDVQDKYEMFNDLDNAWLSEWLSHPETIKRFQNKDIYQFDPFYLDIPNDEIRISALKNLEKLPVYDFERFGDYGLSRFNPFSDNYVSNDDLNYNNRLQGFKERVPQFAGDTFMSELSSMFDQDNATLGYYNPIANYIAMNNLNPDMMGVLTHEGIHATDEFQDINEDAIKTAFGPQRPYDEGLDIYGTVDEDGRPRLGTEYLDEDGLYPRIMDIRRNLGVKPGELVTEKMLDDGFDNNESIQLALEQLSQYYTPEQILQMFNSLASNDQEPDLDKAYGGRETREQKRAKRDRQGTKLADNFSHFDFRADGSIITIEDKVNKFLDKQEKIQAAKDRRGIGIDHVGKSGDGTNYQNWRDRKNYKKFIKSTFDDIHEESDHQYMYKNDPTYRGNYNLAKREMTKKFKNPNYEPGGDEAEYIQQFADVDVAGTDKARMKFADRRRQAKAMNHVFAELKGTGALPSGYGDEAWGDYVERYDKEVKNAKNMAAYDKYAKQARKGKISSEDFAKMYESRGWSEYDPNSVKEEMKGLWKMQTEIGLDKKRQDFATGVKGALELTGVPAAINIIDSPLDTVKDVLHTGADVLTGGGLFSDTNPLTGEKFFTHTQGLEDIVGAAGAIAPMTQAFKLGAPLNTLYKGSRLNSIADKTNKVLKYNPFSQTSISSIYNPIVDKVNDVRGALNMAPGSKVKGLNKIQTSTPTWKNTTLSEAVGTGINKIKKGVNTGTGKNIFNETNKQYTGIGSDFSAYGLMKDKATYGTLLGDNTAGDVLTGNYDASKSSAGRLSLNALNQAGVDMDLTKEQQRVVDKGFSGQDVGDLINTTLNFSKPLGSVADLINVDKYNFKLLNKGLQKSGATDFANKGYDGKYNVFDDLRAAKIEETRNKAARASVDEEKVVRDLRAQEFIQANKKHGGEHDLEEAVNTREFNTPYLGESLYSTPEQVIQLQEALKDAGFDIGKSGVDGILGPNTRDAFTKYIDSTTEYDPRVSNYDSRLTALNIMGDDVSPLVSLAIDKADRDFKEEEVQKLRSVFQRVNLSSKAISKMVGDVDSEWLESASAGILGTESRLGTYASDGILKADPFDQTADLSKNPYSTMPTIRLGDIKRGIQNLVGMDDAEKSLGIAKTKFENIDPEERAFLNITSAQDLLDPQKSIDLTILSLAKRYNRLKSYSSQFPELNMTDDDIKNLAILGHNEGDDAQSQTRFGRYTKADGYNPKTMAEELHSMRSLFNPDSKTKDFSSSYYKHLPGGSKLFDYFGSESPTYVANVKKYMDQLYGKVKDKNLSGSIYNPDTQMYMKKSGGEKDKDMMEALAIYKDFFNNKYTGNPNAKSAEKLYELLNRKFYPQAKQNNMSPANYIMTNMV